MEDVIGKEGAKSVTVEVDTPDGTLYYTIIEGKNGQPAQVISTFGKTGTSVAAWANAVDQLTNLLLQNDVKINEILEALRHITTGKPIVTLKGVRVGSGPEGLVVAFQEYKRLKFRELQETFNADDDEEEERAS